MELLQVLLIVAGLVTAAGGVIMLVRGAASSSVPRPYIPLGMVAVGVIIAYRAYDSFATLDGQDVTIMFVFALALISLMGLRFFIVERARTAETEREVAQPQETEKSEP